MSEMIERVAKAIFKQAIGHDPVEGEMPPHWLGHARAAIEAMREPTEAMASHPMATCYNPGPYGDKEVRRIWRSMINVALAKTPA